MSFEPFDSLETKSRDQIERLAWLRLRRVLRYAYDYIPFYRSRFKEAGLIPADMRSPVDFARLPRFTKRDALRQQEKDGGQPFGMALEAGGRGAAVFALSSGTEGTAIMYQSEAWVRARAVSTARAYWLSGLRPGMRVMATMPAWHGMGLCERSLFEKLIPAETIIVPWGTFLPQFAGQLLDVIMQWRPTWMNLFLPMLYALLGECRRRGIAPKEAFASVRHLCPVGAPMTPHGREGLIETLGVEDIFEGYGNNEAIIAPACDQHIGHHNMLDTGYVEIVDPDTGELLPPGKRGSVVVTSLIPHGSVYVRFDTEDIGEILPDQCPCGRPWPLMEVYDRAANRFTVAGRTLVPYDIRCCLDEVRPLVGVPCAVIRGKGDMPVLRLMMERPQGADIAALSAAAATEMHKGLGLETRIEWVEALPARWKGTPIIEEAEWERGPSS